MKVEFSDAAWEFVEAFGLMAEQDGAARSVGKVSALLMLAERPLSFTELAETLQLSRGAISMTTRNLLSVGAIETVTLRGDRQLYYRTAPEVYERNMRLWIERRQKSLATVERALACPEAASATVKARLAELGQYFMDEITSRQKLNRERRTSLSRPERAP